MHTHVLLESSVTSRVFSVVYLPSSCLGDLDQQKQTSGMLRIPSAVLR